MGNAQLKRVHEMHSPRAWMMMGILGSVVLFVLPMLNLRGQPGSFFYVPDYLIALFGKMFCYAVVAIAMDDLIGRSWLFDGQRKRAYQTRKKRQSVLAAGHGHWHEGKPRRRDWSRVIVCVR